MRDGHPAAKTRSRPTDREVPTPHCRISSTATNSLQNNSVQARAHSLFRTGLRFQIQHFEKAVAIPKKPALNRVTALIAKRPNFGHFIALGMVLKADAKKLYRQAAKMSDSPGRFYGGASWDIGFSQRQSNVSALRPNSGLSDRVRCHLKAVIPKGLKERRLPARFSNSANREFPAKVNFRSVSSF